MGSSHPEIHPSTRLHHPPLDETHLAHIAMGFCSRSTSYLSSSFASFPLTDPPSLQAPWEIFRYTVPVNTLIKTSRIVDTYSKSGDIGLYSTFFGLVPDYNIGISVLAASDSPNRQVPPIRGTLVDIFYNAPKPPRNSRRRTPSRAHFAREAGRTRASRSPWTVAPACTSRSGPATPPISRRISSSQRMLTSGCILLPCHTRTPAIP